MTMFRKLLYIGYFYPNDVAESRGLGRNTAGNNRAIRIAGALLNAGEKVEVISPGIAAQCRLTRRLLFRSCRTSVHGVDFLIAPAVGIPIIGAAVETVVFPVWLLWRVVKEGCGGVIIYNSSPSLAVIACVLRLFSIPFIAQVEDVSVPQMSDWRIGSHARPLRQVIFWLCMKAIVSLSAGLLLPSRRFMRFLPRRKPTLLVHGCVGDHDLQKCQTRILGWAPIRVLYACCKYEAEHGLTLLTQTIKILRRTPLAGRRLMFDCCGVDVYPEGLRSLSESAGDPIVRLHGFLSEGDYRTLLQQSDVALVLQESRGRHANLKSPSKAYEFLSAGKLVIATDVGDFSEYADSYLVLLRSETAEEIALVLRNVSEKPDSYETIATNASAMSAKEFSYRTVSTRLVGFFAQSAGFRASRRT